MPVSLFVAITENPYEGSTLNGVYPTFEEAREDVETRTTAQPAAEYGDDYGIDRAGIEEWAAARRINRWERDPTAPLNWIVDQWN